MVCGGALSLVQAGAEMVLGRGSYVMTPVPPRRRRKDILVSRTVRAKLALVISAAVIAASAVLAGPASAATLTNPSWAVSNSQTGASSVTYTYQFTTATAGVVASVTMTVPSGTAGSPAVAANYGIGAGSIALSGTTLTYTVTTAVSIAAGIPLYISVSGLTNTTTSGSYTSTITTQTSVPATIDSATTAAVTFGGSNTAVTAVVAKSLTFTNDTASFSLQLDPSLAALSDQSKTVTLTVKTNAGGGYSLAVLDTGLKVGTYQIPAVSSGTSVGVASGSFGANKFGYAVAVTAGGGSGLAAQGALATSGTSVGYITAAGGQNAAVATAPTGSAGDTIAITNRVKIDYSTPAGAFADTISYVVTPTY